MPYKIYSIESRKGGVGKTTIALNLASVLVKRKEPVLLLDCDITGTSIADPAKNSPFWRTETNVVTVKDKEGKTVELNLLQYFLENYIKGIGNVRSIIRNEGLKVGKINVIGSFLYGTPKECATNTSWLMDELHSYWMVEFVQQIVKEFEGLYPDRTVHVIIDNSPGYTSFSQALHAYMYEVGPAVAKYLLVSTLDSQDLQANIEAAAEISKSINYREMAANYYMIKEKEADGVESEPDYDIETLIETNDDIKEFFYHLIDDKNLINIYADGNYKNYDYMALLLNKIPQSFKDDETEIEYEEMVRERFGLFLNIAGSKGGDPQNLVYYDEAIVYQYYLKYLRGKISATARDTTYWQRRLREMKQQVEDTISLPPIEAKDKLTTYFENIQTSLSNRGYAQIAKQFSITWSPEYAYNSLKTGISNASRKGIIKAVEIPSQKEKDMLYVWNREQLKELGSLMNERTPEYTYVADLITALEEYAGYKDEKKRPGLMVLVSLLLHCFRIAYLYKEDWSISFRDFVLAEYYRYPHSLAWKDIVGKEVEVNPELKLDVEHIIRFFRGDFDRLYHNFCYTLIRLIDQQEDFSMLISAINPYVPSAPPMAFSKEMVDYISSVSYRKKERPNDNRLSAIRANSYVMKNMQDVLRDNVLKYWK